MQRKRSRAPEAQPPAAGLPGREPRVTAARYALGILALAITVGALATTALALRRRFLPAWEGAPARLSEIVLGLAVMTAILELLGTVGLFRLVPIVLVTVATAAVTARATRGAGARDAGSRDAGARDAGARDAGARDAGAADKRGVSSRAQIAIAAAVTAAVMAEWAVPTLSSYDIGIRAFDSLWYHLPWAASFAQTGHIATLRFTDVEYLTAFYPAGAELVHGLGIVLLGRDTLSPALNLFWLGLVLLAAWCIGRPRGLGALTTCGAALAMATPMMRFSQAGSAANDVAGVFFLLAAIAVFVNLREDDGRAALALAALSAGLAVAVKLSLLAPVLALTVGVVVLRAPRRRTAALWIAGLAVGGGYWYLRNLIAVGNPLPWLSLGVLPTPDPPLQQHTAFSVAHYLTDAHIWTRYLQPGLADGLGPWWQLILAAAVIGPVVCALGSDRTVRMLGLVALAAIVGYLLTPESAAGPAGAPSGFAFNLRYAAPALTLSLVTLPLAPALDGPRRRLATLLVLLAALVATVVQARLWPGAYIAGAVLVGVLVGAVALVPWRRLGAPLAGPGVRSAARAVLVAGLILLAGAAAAAGYGGQRHYLRGRYAYQPGVSSLSTLWAWFRSVHDQRVALAGTFGGFFSYPLFGLDGSNRVQYIGRRGPHGSFTPVTSCAEWRRLIDAGAYRYVVTTPGRDPWHPRTLLPSPEAAWTASDPAARLVFSHRALGRQISVYRLSGPLNPAACR